MKRISHILVAFFVIFSNFLFGQENLKKMQKYERVQLAFAEKSNILNSKLSSLGLRVQHAELLLIAYKDERLLEVWLRDKDSTRFIHAWDYPFCTTSGVLGPKRMEGDFQIPEGLYKIDYFNPESSYYLSMRVNYPNKSDEIRGKKGSLGGEIFIHGNCCSIGCIPITDELIKELFILAIQTSENKDIQVMILPTKLDSEGLKMLRKNYANKPEVLNFWNELVPFYVFFEKNNYLPSFKIDSKGQYKLRN